MTEIIRDRGGAQAGEWPPESERSTLDQGPRIHTGQIRRAMGRQDGMGKQATGATRIALVGAGRIGVAHVCALAGVDGVDLSICDVDAIRAQQVAAQLGVGHVAIGDVFARGSGIDGVVIATPTSTHEDLVLGCAQARRRVRSGELGEIHRVHRLACDQSPPGEQFVATSGGIFQDCLIHDFDALRWVTGREVEEVFAYGAVRGEPFYTRHADVDEAVVVQRMDDDTLAAAHTSRSNGRGYDVRMEISGTSGNATAALEPRAPLVGVEPGVTFPDDDPWADFIARFTTSYEAELRAFVDMVRGVSESPCPIDQGWEALIIALAATRSCREGRPVRVDEIRRS